MTTPTTEDGTAVAQALAAATAAADVLPSSAPLSTHGARPGTPEVAHGFAGAATALVQGAGEAAGHLAVLVGNELVDALAASPLDGLDLAAAVQPALDAAARVLGGYAAAATTVDTSLVLADLGACTVVPLGGDGTVGTAAVVLISDALLPADPGPGVQAVATQHPVATGGAVTDAAGSSPHPQLPAGTPTPASGAAPRRGIEMLHGVDLEVTVELGRTRMTVRDLLALAPGAVLELDRAAGSPADLLVNGRLIARGEVVVVDEDFGLRVTEILDAGANG